MPSVALLNWQNDRMLRLQQIELQCAAALAGVPPNAHLIDENLRGYAVLLSAHFQGFSRDLYTECVQVIASKVRTRLQPLIQSQFNARRHLEHGNPNIDNIAADFSRFDIDLKAELATDPANQPRREHLTALNKWRNVAAHQGTSLPPGIPLNLPAVQAWRRSCDELATAIDGILYNELRKTLRRAPW
jgi:hypothetical protein